MNTAIIVHCHNNEDAVVECLDSILNQGEALDFLYVIDDASTDSSWFNIMSRFNEVDKLDFVTKHNNTKVIAQSNEFEDGYFRTFTNCVLAHDWIGSLPAKFGFLAGKLNSIEEYFDENFAHIYGDFIDIDGVRSYYTSHWTDRPDVGFFNRAYLEKINLNNIKDFKELTDVLRKNFLVGHLPEALTYVISGTERGEAQHNYTGGGDQSKA